MLRGDETRIVHHVAVHAERGPRLRLLDGVDHPGSDRRGVRIFLLVRLAVTAARAMARFARHAAADVALDDRRVALQAGARRRIVRIGDADRLREAGGLWRVHLLQRVKVIIRRRTVLLFRPQLFAIVVVAVYAFRPTAACVLLGERRAGRSKAEGQRDRDAQHNEEILLCTFLHHGHRSVAFRGNFRYGNRTSSPAPVRMKLLSTRKSADGSKPAAPAADTRSFCSTPSPLTPSPPTSRPFL